MRYISFSNYSGLNASCLLVFGGSYRDGAIAGAFYLDVYHLAAYSSASIGVRLMFL